MDDHLVEFIRKAIDSAESVLAVLPFESSAHVRALALLWAAYDELEAVK